MQDTRMYIQGRNCRVNTTLAQRLDLHGPDRLSPIVAAALGEPVPGNLLKSDRRSQVHRFDAADRRWVAKRYRVREPVARLYRRLRVSPPWREWKGAARLRRIGVRAVEPLMVIDDDQKPGASGVIVLPYTEGQTLHDLILDTANRTTEEAPRVQRERIARSLGRQLGRITAAGWVNRDHKPGNLIVDARCREGDEPVVIDPCGLRRRSARYVDRMLATLVATIIRIDRLETREALACLNAMCQADPTLAPDRRARRDMAHRVRQWAVRERDAALARERRAAPAAAS